MLGRAGSGRPSLRLAHGSVFRRFHSATIISERRRLHKGPWRVGIKKDAVELCRKVLHLASRIPWVSEEQNFLGFGRTTIFYYLIFLFHLCVCDGLTGIIKFSCDEIFASSASYYASACIAFFSCGTLLAFGEICGYQIPQGSAVLPFQLETVQISSISDLWGSFSNKIFFFFCA